MNSSWLFSSFSLKASAWTGWLNFRRRSQSRSSVFTAKQHLILSLKICTLCCFSVLSYVHLLLQGIIIWLLPQCNLDKKDEKEKQWLLKLYCDRVCMTILYYIRQYYKKPECKKKEKNIFCYILHVFLTLPMWSSQARTPTHSS